MSQHPLGAVDALVDPPLGSSPVSPTLFPPPVAGDSDGAPGERAKREGKMRSPAEVARFWAKVDKDGPTPAQRPDLGPCWVWTAFLRDGGYGGFAAEAPNGRKTTATAHRYCYELLVGPIPDGLYLDHLCENRACVNPQHVEPVTNQVNLVRGRRVREARAATHCPHGHEWTPENTIWKGDARTCRACKNENHRKRKHRIRAEYNEARKTNPDLPRPSTLRR